MFANKNYETLKIKYPKLYEKMIDIQSTSLDDFQIVISKNGYPTVKINKNNKFKFLHSKYNPLSEAKQMTEDCYSEDINTYIVYGFGLGYHIEELIRRQPNSEIFIFESNKNIFKLALENRNLSDILKRDNVKIVLEENIINFTQQLSQMIGKVNSKFIIHMPSLNAIPESLIEVKYLLEDFRMKENTIERFKEILDYNFNKNILKYDYCISTLFDKFKKIPIIIISAGPSLEKNIKKMINTKGKTIIMSVGTAVKPLLKEGIEPDIIIITDPQDIVTNQLEDISIKVPIIILSTANDKVIKDYKGIKFIAMQKGYPCAEQYVNYDEYKLVNTGGSVATTALDIALRFGCNPIIFVGQDLAFTNGESHIKDTYFYDKIIDTSNLRPIRSQNNDIVYTSKNLYQYLKWIEKRIKKEDNKLFINATEGGAFIEGTTQIDLNTVIDRYLLDTSIDFKCKLQEILKN